MYLHWYLVSKRTFYLTILKAAFYLDVANLCYLFDDDNNFRHVLCFCSTMFLSFELYIKEGFLLALSHLGQNAVRHNPINLLYDDLHERFRELMPFPRFFFLCDCDDNGSVALQKFYILKCRNLFLLHQENQSKFFLHFKMSYTSKSKIQNVRVQQLHDQ